MKRKILALTMVVALVSVLMVPMAALADDEGTVAATVSGKLIALTVTDGSAAYGIIAASATKNTALYDSLDNPLGSTEAQTQTIKNTGTVVEDFAMKTSIAVADSGTDWTLHADTAGEDLMTHAYLVSATAYDGQEAIGTFTKWADLDYVSEAGGADVAVDGEKFLELQIGMPTTITTFTTHTITVTVLATES